MELIRDGNIIVTAEVTFDVNAYWYLEDTYGEYKTKLDPDDWLYVDRRRGVLYADGKHFYRSMPEEEFDDSPYSSFFLYAEYDEDVEGNVIITDPGAAASVKENHDTRSCQYFVPNVEFDENLADIYDEERIREAGVVIFEDTPERRALAVAASYGVENYKRAEQYNSGRWWLESVKIDILLNGAQIITHFSSAYESEDSKSYKIEVAGEALVEAIKLFRQWCSEVGVYPGDELPDVDLHKAYELVGEVV